MPLACEEKVIYRLSDLDSNIRSENIGAVCLCNGEKFGNGKTAGMEIACNMGKYLNDIFTLFINISLWKISINYY